MESHGVTDVAHFVNYAYKGGGAALIVHMVSSLTFRPFTRKSGSSSSLCWFKRNIASKKYGHKYREKNIGPQ